MMAIGIGIITRPHESIISLYSLTFFFIGIPPSFPTHILPLIHSSFQIMFNALLLKYFLLYSSIFSTSFVVLLFFLKEPLSFYVLSLLCSSLIVHVLYNGQGMLLLFALNRINVLFEIPHPTFVIKKSSNESFINAKFEFNKIVNIHSTKQTKSFGVISCW